MNKKKLYELQKLYKSFSNNKFENKNKVLRIESTLKFLVTGSSTTLEAKMSHGDHQKSAFFIVLSFKFSKPIKFFSICSIKDFINV